jgi:hypothetical protein
MKVLFQVSSKSSVEWDDAVVTNQVFCSCWFQQSTPAPTINELITAKYGLSLETVFGKMRQV